MLKVNQLLTRSLYAGVMSFHTALPKQFFNTFNRLYNIYRKHHAIPVAAFLTVRDIVRETHTILAYLRTGDQALAARLRENLRLSSRPEPCHIPETFFSPASVSQPQPATIFIPVHNAFDDLRTLLCHLPDTLSGAENILLINDASTDPRIAPLLQSFAAITARCQLLHLNTNLGFLGAVNRGFELADPAKPIILLNTDALPSRGWVPRLLAPLNNPNVATVTPLSNKAEILSIPGPNTVLSYNVVQRIDAMAQRFDAPFHNTEIPTGIGFCMAINPDFLSKVGFLDPAFGKGYGEEVDWCQRARQQGGQHLVAANVFVGHRGGGSFGTEKATRLKHSAREITRRYPAYDQEVAEWARSDPIAPQRIALTIARLDAESHVPVPLFLGHQLGGGAEIALQDEVSVALENAPGAVIFRPGARTDWEIEVRTNHTTQSAAMGGEMLHRLLQPLRQFRLIYSCGVGAFDPASVPRLLSALARKSTTFEARLHDYFPISPSYCLLDSSGRFSGPPHPSDTDAAHQVAKAPGRASLTLTEWRKLWSCALDQASEITAYSKSSAALFAAAFPKHQNKISIRPHTPRGLPPPLPAGGSSIGVLGGINRAKGGAVLQSLAPHLKNRLVLIGELDRQFRLPKPHRVHGPYQKEQIASLAKKYDIGIWFIPSIWPETFSFTTHEVLATDLPVACFPLGAQEEAARLAENGYLLSAAPYDAMALSAELSSLFTVTKSRETP